MNKKIVTLDIECYRNYFLVMFRGVDSGKVHYFDMLSNEGLNVEPIQAIMRTHTIVTFNGLNYDLPMLCLALSGMRAYELYEASCKIINAGLRGWQTAQEYGFEVPLQWDTIDLMEPVPGVMIGLKLYGARLHSKKLQDLPYAFDSMLTPEQMAAVREYCVNDHMVTAQLYKEVTSDKNDIIKTRKQLGDEFGIELRSKSDAQCAEAIIKKEVSKLLGVPVQKPKFIHGALLKYKPPAFLRFQSQQLRDVLATVCNANFYVAGNGSPSIPDEFKSLTLTIGASTYKMGIGGLHSTEKSVSHYASNTVSLIDRDVVSYYPSLILQCGLNPSNMGEHFQTVYKTFFDRRIQAKRDGDSSVAQTLKILLNGTFGKLGSPYSAMYSPDLLLQVTLTGQLALLMLIEALETSGIPVLSANTDGVVMACPRDMEATYRQVIANWERDTGLETEETRYRSVHSRDVNNYLAVKPNGDTKAKGVLVPSGLAKNPNYDIVSWAAQEFLTKGVPIANTIFGCKDVRKFIQAKRVTGGGHWKGEYLGKVVRWYRSTKGHSINYVKNGNQVGGSEGAKPLMVLPDELPTDIDYNFYLSETFDLLTECGYYK